MVGDSLLFLKFVSAEWWGGGWSCRLSLGFCLPIWLTELNFWDKMAKYLRIIGLHISKKSRTFALAKK